LTRFLPICSPITKRTPTAWGQDDPDNDIQAFEAYAHRAIAWATTTPPWNSPEMLRRLRGELAGIVTDGDHARFTAARNAARAQLRYGEHA
jgi:hypothetical protein